MTLVEFLLARIAEDEAVVREATDGPWPDPLFERIGPGGWWIEYPADGEDEGVPQWAHIVADIIHVVRWDPARVLAECEAKRAIVALDDEWNEPTTYETMQLLAAVYADHPDFDEAWRP